MASRAFYLLLCLNIVSAVRLKPARRECAVCMEDMVSGQISVLRCGHNFCSTCIPISADDRVIDKCPKCRRVIDDVFPFFDDAGDDSNDGEVDKQEMRNVDAEDLKEKEFDRIFAAQEQNASAIDEASPSQVTNKESADLPADSVGAQTDVEPTHPAREQNASVPTVDETPPSQVAREPSPTDSVEEKKSAESASTQPKSGDPKTCKPRRSKSKKAPASFDSKPQHDRAQSSKNQKTKRGKKQDSDDELLEAEKNRIRAQEGPFETLQRVFTPYALKINTPGCHILMTICILIFAWWILDNFLYHSYFAPADVTVLQPHYPMHESTVQSNDMNIRLVCMSSALWKAGWNYPVIKEQFLGSMPESQGSLLDVFSMIARKRITPNEVRNLWQDFVRRAPNPEMAALGIPSHMVPPPLFLVNTKVQLEPKQVISCFIDHLLMTSRKSYMSWKKRQPADWADKIENKSYVQDLLKNQFPGKTIDSIYNMANNLLVRQNARLENQAQFLVDPNKEMDAKIKLQKGLVTNKLQQEHFRGWMNRQQLLALSVMNYQMRLPRLYSDLWKHGFSIAQVEAALDAKAKEKKLDTALKLTPRDLQEILDESINPVQTHYSTTTAPELFSIEKMQITPEISLYHAIEKAIMLKKKPMSYKEWKSERPANWKTMYTDQKQVIAKLSIIVGFRAREPEVFKEVDEAFAFYYSSVQIGERLKKRNLSWADLSSSKTQNNDWSLAEREILFAEREIKK